MTHRPSHNRLASKGVHSTPRARLIRADRSPVFIATLQADCYVNTGCRGGTAQASMSGESLPKYRAA